MLLYHNYSVVKKKKKKKLLERKVERGRKVSAWNNGFDIYIPCIHACGKWCESGEWWIERNWACCTLSLLSILYFIVGAMNIAHLSVITGPLGEVFNRPVSIFFFLQIKVSQLILMCAAAFLRQALCSAAYLWCCPLPASGTHSDLSQSSEGV